MDNELTIQLNLRINPVLKKTLEFFAKKRLTTKSALLREALLDLFDKHGVELKEEPKPTDWEAVAENSKQYLPTED